MSDYNFEKPDRSETKPDNGDRCDPLALAVEEDFYDLRNGLAALSLLWRAVETGQATNDDEVGHGVRFCQEKMEDALERLGKKLRLK